VSELVRPRGSSYNRADPAAPTNDRKSLSCHCSRPSPTSITRTCGVGTKRSTGGSSSHNNRKKEQKKSAARHHHIVLFVVVSFPAPPFVLDLHLGPDGTDDIPAHHGQFVAANNYLKKIQRKRKIADPPRGRYHPMREGQGERGRSGTSPFRRNDPPQFPPPRRAVQIECGIVLRVCPEGGPLGREAARDIQCLPNDDPPRNGRRWHPLHFSVRPHRTVPFPHCRRHVVGTGQKQGFIHVAAAVTSQGVNIPIMGVLWVPWTHAHHLGPTGGRIHDQDGGPCMLDGSNDPSKRPLLSPLFDMAAVLPSCGGVVVVF
jgi:hypothetical protein